MPAPPEPSSPTPGEGPSGRKRRRAPREGRRAGAVLTPELAPVQVGPGLLGLATVLWGLGLAEQAGSGWGQLEKGGGAGRVGGG